MRFWSFVICSYYFPFNCGLSFVTTPVFRASVQSRGKQSSLMRTSMKECHLLHEGADLWFENERIRLFNVMMSPGQVVHWNCSNPIVRWVVGDSEFSETRSENSFLVIYSFLKFCHNLCRSDCPSPEKLILPDKSVRYYEAFPAVTWSLRNDKVSPAREIVFELLDERCVWTALAFGQLPLLIHSNATPPIRRPRFSKEEVEAMQRACVFSPQVGTALLLDNDRCRAWDFSYPPDGPPGGAPDEVHQHTLDYVFCTPCGGPAAVAGSVRLLGYNPDGSLQFDSESHDGEVRHAGHGQRRCGRSAPFPKPATEQPAHLGGRMRHCTADARLRSPRGCYTAQWSSYGASGVC